VGTIVYDEGCRACRFMVALVLAWDRAGSLGARGYGEAVSEGLVRGDEPGLTASWHFVAASGERHSAGRAVAPMARTLPLGGLLVALDARAPGLVDRAYRAVATRRSGLSRLVPGRLLRWADATIERRRR
jgi:predicted DCC family thiol-disulfide oxidoreductase YuxK